jgi:hypothetical protein
MHLQSACSVMDIKFTVFWNLEIHAVELLVPDPSPYVFEIDIGKLTRYRSPGSDQIPAELIQAGGETSWSEIHKLINSIWNKEELPDQWKESIIVPVCKKGDKTDCSNYHGISLLSTSTKIVSSILLSQLSPSTDEFIGDQQCGFQHKRSTTDPIFCTHQILEKKMGVQRDSTSAIQRFQESLWSIVQYSHRVWDTHETS